MQFSTAFALILNAFGASGALASSDYANPESAKKLQPPRRLPKADKSSKSGKSKTSKSGKSKTSKVSKKLRRAYLAEEFPWLGPLASKTTVATYTEKDNTYTMTRGTVSEAWSGSEFDARTYAKSLVTSAGQKITKSEATLLCVTKCEEVIEGCTLFQLSEYANPLTGEVTSYMCLFYGDESIIVQFPIVNPVGGDNSHSVFYKGKDLAVPDHHGCDVPLGKNETLPLITCRVNKFAGAPPSPACEDLLESASSDFETYIWPGVQCIFETDMAKFEGCLDCLAEAAVATDGPYGCHSKRVCGEDSFITKKCAAPETSTADGKTPKVSKDCCGDVCPSEKVCVSKIATSFLCQFGAVPRWDAAGTAGGCMHSDTPGHFTYLADSGNGDYECLKDASLPAFM